MEEIHVIIQIVIRIAHLHATRLTLITQIIIGGMDILHHKEMEVIQHLHQGLTKAILHKDMVHRHHKVTIMDTVLMGMDHHHHHNHIIMHHNQITNLDQASILKRTAIQTIMLIVVITRVEIKEEVEIQISNRKINLNQKTVVGFLINLKNQKILMMKIKMVFIGNVIDDFFYL